VAWRSGLAVSDEWINKFRSHSREVLGWGGMRLTAWRSLIGALCLAEFVGGVRWRSDLAERFGGATWRSDLAERFGGAIWRSDLAE